MSREKRIENARRPITAWGYFWFRFLYAIPVVGLLALLINTFRKRNINSRNFARSYWCTLLVRIIVIALVIGIGLILFNTVKDENGKTMKEHFTETFALFDDLKVAVENGDPEAMKNAADSISKKLDEIKPEGDVVPEEAIGVIAPAEEIGESDLVEVEPIIEEDKAPVSEEAPELPADEAPADEIPVDEIPVEVEELPEEDVIPAEG